MASLGALITIIAISMDPFVAIAGVHLQLRLNGPWRGCSLPRTQLFDEMGGYIGAGLNAMSTGFMGSLATGQFSSSPTQPPFSCAIGNCTFQQEYSPVGYCSSCKDVSDQLVFEDFQTSTGSAFNVTV